jgi:hypothetical protein
MARTMAADLRGVIRILSFGNSVAETAGTFHVATRRPGDAENTDEKNRYWSFFRVSASPREFTS